jgi:tRNA(Arg) A34 adenosine deaminase TadA
MNKYMQIADELSKQNLLTGNGGPFGAIVVKDGIIVGVGNNRVVGSNDPTAHAEVMAIRNACQNLNTFDLSGCSIVTSCYPCPMCLSAIIWANIKEVYYGNTKEDAADIGFRDDFIYDYLESLTAGEPKEDILKLIQMDRDETIKAFEAFKNKTDKTMY